MTNYYISFVPLNDELPVDHFHNVGAFEPFHQQFVVENQFITWRLPMNQEDHSLSAESSGFLIPSM